MLPWLPAPCKGDPQSAPAPLPPPGMTQCTLHRIALGSRCIRSLPSRPLYCTPNQTDLLASLREGALRYPRRLPLERRCECPRLLDQGPAARVERELVPRRHRLEVGHVGVLPEPPERTGVRERQKGRV